MARLIEFYYHSKTSGYSCVPQKIRDTVQINVLRIFVACVWYLSCLAMDVAEFRRNYECSVYSEAKCILNTLRQCMFHCRWKQLFRWPSCNSRPNKQSPTTCLRPWPPVSTRVTALCLRSIALLPELSARMISTHQLSTSQAAMIKSTYSVGEH